MKKTLLFIAFFLCSLFVFAQDESADSLHQSAKGFMRQGNFDSALLLLNQALQIKSNDLSLLKDEAFVNYLKRDFAKSIAIGNKIISRHDADEQSFQILGLAYKAIADYKNADRIYKIGLKKFPNSGILYSEYGDMLSQNKNEAGAIKLWEKGIQADPNNSNNYYNAVMYYSNHSNFLWAVLYAETFINIESLTKRTIEIRDLLVNNYKKLFISTTLNNISQNGTPFEKAVAATFSKLSDIVKQGFTPETLTELRTRFILDWDEQFAAKFPFRLFDYHRQLLRDGMFDAYNQWVFGPSISTDAFQAWINAHNDEVTALQNLQHNMVYKIPPGQYYLH
ncbi:MAG: tetratricopeptide repeat protein [Chitinophagaceae bacterium]